MLVGARPFSLANFPRRALLRVAAVDQLGATLSTAPEALNTGMIPLILTVLSRDYRNYSLFELRLRTVSLRGQHPEMNPLTVNPKSHTLALLRV